MHPASTSRRLLELRASSAWLRIAVTAEFVLEAIKANPHWFLQPRVPEGNPNGGQWTRSQDGRQWTPRVVQASGPLLPVLQRLGPPAVQALRQAARRIAPILRRIPKHWGLDSAFPDEDDYDDETRRISASSWQRFGYPNIRFRSETELRRYLGPAGSGREWHHIVEKRLAGRSGFPVEIIHSTDNIINLPAEVHRRISARMSMRFRAFENNVRRNGLEKLSYG